MRVRYLSGDKKGQTDHLDYHSAQSALEAGAIEVVSGDDLLKDDPLAARVERPARPGEPGPEVVASAPVKQVAAPLSPQQQHQTPIAPAQRRDTDQSQSHKKK